MSDSLDPLHQTHQKTPAAGWLRLAVHLDASRAETGAALLATLTGNGVEIHDRTATRTTILSYIRIDAGLEAKKARLAGALAQLAPGYQWEETFVPDTDWNEEWKKHFHPTRITRRLVVSPSWAGYRAKKGEIVIELDPGMAFGTGHHATTRLMLHLLESHAATGRRTALDVGTGTGILAIAAALLGCPQVTAVDNDPEAIRAASKNVRRNRLDGRVLVSDAPLASMAAGRYDLVLANIVLDTLLALADDLGRVLAPNGCLILSGILRGKQEQRIEQACAARGLQPCQKAREGEWAAIAFQRPGG